MTAVQAQFLAGPEAPGADHQEAAHAHDSQPYQRDPPIHYRIAAAEMHRSSQQASRRRNRHTDKIFAVRAVPDCAAEIVADVEACQTGDSANEKKKTDEGPGVEHVLVQLLGANRQKMKAPDKRQQTWCHSKSDGIGQRIQFSAELATGIGHACDAAIQRVQRNGDQDGNGRLIQMKPHVPNPGEGLHRLKNGKVSRRDIAHRKK